jgi:hypothetical protein
VSDSFQPVPVVFSPPSYPLIAFLVRWGRIAATVVGLLPFVGGVLVAVLAGQPIWWIAAGAAATAVVTVLLLSYVELLRIIDDMLLPK